MTRCLIVALVYLFWIRSEKKKRFTGLYFYHNNFFSLIPSKFARNIMTDRYKTCRSGHRLYETWPHEALRSFNPFNTLPQFTNKLWQCRFTTYLCSAQKTPRATILSQWQWVDLLRILSLSNTAACGYQLSFSRFVTLPWQNKTQLTRTLRWFKFGMQYFRVLRSCINYAWRKSWKLKKTSQMLSSIALRFEDKSKQVQQWVTLQQRSDILTASVIQIENMLSWISRYTWHNRIFVSSQANISSF